MTLRVSRRGRSSGSSAVLLLDAAAAGGAIANAAVSVAHDVEVVGDGDSDIDTPGADDVPGVVIRGDGPGVGGVAEDVWADDIVERGLGGGGVAGDAVERGVAEGGAAGKVRVSHSEDDEAEIDEAEGHEEDYRQDQGGLNDRVSVLRAQLAEAVKPMHEGLYHQLVPVQGVRAMATDLTL